MSQHLFRLLLVLAMLLASVAPYAAAQETPDVGPHRFHANPVVFVENMGQWVPSAGSGQAPAAGSGQAPRFQAWGGPAGTIWLAEDALWITVVERSTGDGARAHGDTLERLAPERADANRDDLPRQAVNVRLSFVAANPHPRLEPFDRLDTVVSYFIGSDPEKWRPEVPVWGGVCYVELYPGIDLELTSEGGRMVQRLAARPGADLAAVRLRVEGADAVAVDGDTLRLTTAAGDVVLPLLRAEGVQGVGARGTADHKPRKVQRMIVQPAGVQVFDVTAPFAQAHVNPASRDASSRQSELANPQSGDLLYGTFLGGRSFDSGYGIAVDGAGSAYVTGDTFSSDFPTTPGSFDASFNDGNQDAFVIKLNPAGSGLVYATFLGGSGGDRGYGIAVDGAGSAYVTGYTGSTNFPTTPGAFDASFNGFPGDAFVVKLNPADSALAYATFLGGSRDDLGDYGQGIALDATGRAYVTGLTSSVDFPTTPGAFDTSLNRGSASDAFVVKLAMGTSSLRVFLPMIVRGTP